MNHGAGCSRKGVQPATCERCAIPAARQGASEFWMRIGVPSFTLA